MIAALLALALTWPAPWASPELDADYRARLETIAEAVAVESRAHASAIGWTPHLLARVLMRKAWRESRFAADVHAGTRRGDNGRAVCLLQIQESGMVSHNEWRQLGGVDLDSTRRCVRAAIRVLTAQRWRCARRQTGVWMIARSLRGYGTGGSCVPTRLEMTDARVVMGGVE